MAGFRPRRSFLFLTWNLPKPEINKSSPDTSVLFIISSINSTYSEDCFIDQAVFCSHFLCDVGSGESHDQTSFQNHVALSGWIVKEFGITGRLDVGFGFGIGVKLLNITSTRDHLMLHMDISGV